MFPIVLICDSISNSSNIGGLFRLADAFGIEKIYFIGQQTPLGHKMRRASRATEKLVEFEVINDASKILNSLRERNFQILSLEITEDSTDINDFKLKKEKLALIIGNEAEGVSDKLLQYSDSIHHIEMYGQNSSMNVTAATAIALKTVTDRMLLFK